MVKGLEAPDSRTGSDSGTSSNSIQEPKKKKRRKNLPRTSSKKDFDGEDEDKGEKSGRGKMATLKDDPRKGPPVSITSTSSNRPASSSTNLTHRVGPTPRHGGPTHHGSGGSTHPTHRTHHGSGEGAVASSSTASLSHSHSRQRLHPGRRPHAHHAHARRKPAWLRFLNHHGIYLAIAALALLVVIIGEYYRIALNFRGAQFLRFREFIKKFMHP